jgi:dihydrofolate synthase / folylpolyglutamate synthase
MDFEQAVSTIFNRRGFSRNGLKTIRECLHRLGNPQNDFKVIHVAGTNGKGAVSALIAHLISDRKNKVGLFISPHLKNVAERISVNGKNISESDFLKSVNLVLKHESVKLTFFEIITCAAFVYFSYKKVDYVVLEVGLGGRLDSTNVVENTVLSVITSIGLDHVNVLGNSIRKIAAEKAGILRKNVPCLVGKTDKNAYSEISRIARRKKSTLIRLKDSEKFRFVGYDWKNSKMNIKLPDSKAVSIGLLGRHQADNVSLAFKAAKLLNPKSFAAKKPLSEFFWPGRFQIEKANGITYVIDGAHNLPAIKSFVKTFRESPYSKREFSIVFSLMRDKDLSGIVSVLKPYLKKVVLTGQSHERALDPLLMADFISEKSPNSTVEVHASPAMALKSARRKKTVVIVGSLYLVGKTLEILG